MKKDKPEADQFFGESVLARTGRFKNNYQYLTSRGTSIRRSYFTQSEGILEHKFEAAGGPMNAMMDPTKMIGGMKQNLIYTLSTIFMLTWVSTFCSGFILAKVPFPLTQKFRGMLQRGVELNNLDVTYVSSASFYFLALFGVRGLITMIQKDMSDVDPTMAMAMPMMPQAGGPGNPMGKDWNKAFASEKDSLDLMKPADALKGIEEYYLANY